MDTELLECLCCGEPVVNPAHPNICMDCLRRFQRVRALLAAALDAARVSED